jgi:phage N-6-adenine-methyltransferase
MNARKLAPMLSATKSRRKNTEEIVDNSRWGTPPWLYEWVDRSIGFTLDVCADSENHKHPRYFDERTNGLQQPWAGERWWCNPPYGAEISRWVMKCRDSVLDDESIGAALLPHRADTDWWNKFIMQADGEAGRLRACRYVESTRVHWYRWQRVIVGVYVFDQRVPFVGAKHGAPFVSALAIFASLTQEPHRGELAPSPDQFGDPLPDLLAGWPR